LVIWFDRLQGGSLAFSFDAAKDATPSRDGVIYQDPNNPHNSIRIMPGNPNSPNPAQQNPYVIYRNNGISYDMNGLPLPNGNLPEAHIPLNLFDINKMPSLK